MKLNLSSALCLALVSGAIAVKHETSAQAKNQSVDVITYRTVLKGVRPLKEEQVFVDMDDDKKNDSNDDKKDKDDDDDKKSKDDDDAKSRNSSVPDCTTNGANYNRCDPATMKPSDAATCNSIKNGMCGSNMKSSDKDYCTCIGLNGRAVVASANFRPVIKGTGPSKHKRVFIDLEKDDDGGKTDDGSKNTDDGNKNTDDGNKNTDDKGTDDKKTDDSTTDDKKNDDNGTDDKKTDDGIVDDKTNDDGIDDKKNNDDDDKNRKDDDDDKKNKDDDDDDKKNKDDDDDDDKSRNNNLPECITGGKNYLRCDPATMNPSDAATCTSIKNEVCGAGMSSVDESYCECIGLVQKSIVTSLHFRPMLKGTTPMRHKQVFVNLDKDDDGGKTGDGSTAKGSAGSNDDKKNGDTSDDKKNVNTDDDKKNENTDDDKKSKNDDDKTRKNDDDDDKKNKDDDDDKKNKDDDDDDDKKSRNNSVPECVTDGKNYQRCNPATMNPSDAATCNSIKQEVCGSNMSSVDQSYCTCIGLHGKSSSSLRGIIKVSF